MRMLFFFLVVLPLLLPFPALALRFHFALSTSAFRPNFFKTATTSFVLAISENLSSNTTGKEIFSFKTCLFETSSLFAVVAIAESNAALLSFLLIFSPVFFSAFGGCAFGPPTDCATLATLPCMRFLLFFSLGSLACPTLMLLSPCGIYLLPWYLAVLSLPAGLYEPFGCFALACADKTALL